MQEQGTKSRITILMIIAIVLVVLLWTLYQYDFFRTQPAPAGNITELVAKYNKNCPLIIQEGMRLDSVALANEKSVTYYLSLLNVQKETAEIDVIKAEIENSLISTAKENPGLQVFRENDYELVYNYSDKKKNYLFDVTIVPEQYK
jgi:c-di-AMP phosphodiesterase-like protein